MMNRNRPISIARPIVRSYQGVLTRDAGERAAVVAGAAGVGVEDLAKAVRAAVVQVARSPARTGIPVAALRRTE